MRTLSKIRSFCGVLSSLRSFLNRPVSFEQARAGFLRRLQRREENFLTLVRRCVYENPRSPYLPLLDQAGCEYGDLVSGVKRWGLEGLLCRLRDEGVWISLAEFKGHRPIARGRVERPVSRDDFDNTRLRPMFRAATGGSTGAPVRSSIDLDHLAIHAEQDALFVNILGVAGVPLAVWYPQLPSIAGVSTALRYAKLGSPPQRWFDMRPATPGGVGRQGRLATAALVRLSRLSDRPIPHPQRAGPDQLDRVLRWLGRQQERFGRCVLQSYVSQAVRLSRRARSRGHSLAGVQFIVTSEPLTPAKWREIRLSGAGVYARYVCTELGTLGLLCGDVDGGSEPGRASPTEPDDYHLAADLAALIQREEGGVFQLTSLSPTTPKVMINVELGDCGQVSSAPCGCLLGELGLHTHLRRVRSVSRVTAEGAAVPVSELIRIVEELLCPQFGGSVLDYQWVEREGEGGVNRLRLRVAPRVGALDERRLAEAVLAALRARGDATVAAGLWSEASTIEIVRESVQPTGRGKLLPLLRQRETQGESSGKN